MTKEVPNDEALRMAHILMCPPDHYGVEYEINPWMDRRRQADQGQAVEQWQGLRGLLEAAGATVSCLTPVAGLPDLVFTANAAVIYRDKAILSQFRHPQRQAEQPHFERWLTEHGFAVCRLRSDTPFEGAGDALFCGDVLFAGYRIRSDIRAHQEVGRVLGCLVIPLELVDRRFYHLDTCFCPLAPNEAIYYPDAFDEYGQRVLREYVKDLIPVSEAEAACFACNAAVVGRTVITPTGCSGLHRELASRGYRPVETPMDEFIKSGGAAKCLTLRLDGEEAAAWARDGEPVRAAVAISGASQRTPR